MKIKTAELEGAALDCAVAMARGHHICRRSGLPDQPYIADPAHYPTYNLIGMVPKGCCRDWDSWESIPRYSREWSQGGPIIEHEAIALFLGMEPEHGDVERWGAFSYRCGSDKTCYGPTPLIAAMRADVSSKLGDEIEIPNELLNKE